MNIPLIRLAAIGAVLFCNTLFSGNLSFKGLYVDGFAQILNNVNAEDSLLSYAQTNGYTYLCLYDLHLVHNQYNITSSSGSAILANFISKAKTQYGISEVGAAAENYWFFLNRIHSYNNIRTNSNERFDVYNLEFEFWVNSSVGPSGYYCTTYLQPNGFSCDTSGAFQFYENELRKIDSLGNTTGRISEIYVGWFNQGQANRFTPLADRVLLHAYITSPSQAYNYTQTRLSYLGNSPQGETVAVIYSAEPAFMGPWLNSNPESAAYPVYETAFNNSTATWTSNINLIGYQWFAYSFMPYDLTLSSNSILSSSDVHVFNGLNSVEVNWTPLDFNQTIVVELISSEGRIVNQITTNAGAGSTHFSTTGLSAGMYFVRWINQSTRTTQIEKIMLR